MPLLGTFGSNSIRGVRQQKGGGSLYEFTTATFSPGGQTGRFGPSLSQARSGLSGTGTDTWKNNTEFFNVSSGIQLWTVPEAGTYQFTVTGAQGGFNNLTQGGGGNPARVIGRITLIAGETLRIVTGQCGRRGTGGSNLENSSGGGGSFVYSSLNELYFAAGGGGGGSSGSIPSSCNASTGTSGRAGSNSSGDGNGSSGGSGGNRGQQGNYQYSAGAGGGWNTISLDQAHGNCSYPEGGPRNGGGRTNNFQGGYGYSSCQLELIGGFGGGGGGSGACCTSGSGGGGGYSGGGVGNNCCSSKGGGAGSYINPAVTNTSSTTVNQLNGAVIIEKV